MPSRGARSCRAYEPGHRTSTATYRRPIRWRVSLSTSLTSGQRLVNSCRGMPARRVTTCTAATVR
jgi:hypothetical protein